MDFFLAALSGVFIGSVLGFIGAGGAMLSVPILVYGFGFAPLQATTAALLIVFLASFSGLLPKFKTGQVLIREAVVIWSLGLVAILGGTWLAQFLSDGTLLTGFSFVLIFAGASMLVKPPQERDPAMKEKKISPLILIGVSLVIGSMTGLFGIGGGFLAIPLLIIFYNIPPVKAAGTSLLIICLNTLTSFFAHYRTWDSVDWKIPAVISIFGLVVARLASQAGGKVSPSILRKSFAFLLFAIALLTIIQTWLTNGR